MNMIVNGLAAIAASIPVLRPVFNKCVYRSIDAPISCQNNGIERDGLLLSVGVNLRVEKIGDKKTHEKHLAKTTIVC